MIAALALLAITLSSSRALAQADLARAEFQTYCTPCHGADGSGNGPLARQFNLAPPDLARLSARAGGTFPANQVRSRIEGLDMPSAHGTSEMPVWSDWFVREELDGSTDLRDTVTAARNAEERIDRLVKYLESIQD